MVYYPATWLWAADGCLPTSVGTLFQGCLWLRSMVPVMSQNGGFMQVYVLLDQRERK